MGKVVRYLNLAMLIQFYFETVITLQENPWVQFTTITENSGNRELQENPCNKKSKTIQASLVK